MPDSLRLALFDVDGTLVRGGQQLRSWFGEALVEVFGEAGDLDGYSFAGKIDPQIVTELLSGAGLSREQIEAGMPRFQASYLGRLQRDLSRDHLQLLPHVELLLDKLSRRGEITLGLLTGNWELGARAKLSCYGLNRYFSFGSFGDDQQSRRDLPPLALERAAEVIGSRILPAETVVIGDSSLDVECAHEHGMRAAAVATGPASRAELESAGADWVLTDLGEAHRVHPVFRI